MGPPRPATRYREHPCEYQHRRQTARDPLSHRAGTPPAHGCCTAGYDRVRRPLCYRRGPCIYSHRRRRSDFAESRDCRPTLDQSFSQSDDQTRYAWWMQGGRNVGATSSRRCHRSDYRPHDAYRLDKPRRPISTAAATQPLRGHLDRFQARRAGVWKAGTSINHATAYSI